MKSPAVTGRQGTVDCSSGEGFDSTGLARCVVAFDVASSPSGVRPPWKHVGRKGVTSLRGSWFEIFVIKLCPN